MKIFLLLAACFCGALSLISSSQAKALVPLSGALIPFRLIDNRIFITADLNGKGPLIFLFDTGASALLDSKVVEKLGLKTHDPFPLKGGGESSQSASYTEIESLELGGLKFSNMTMTVTDLQSIKNAFGFTAYDGILGSEILNQFVVEIDYAASTLRFTPPEKFKYSGSGSSFLLDLSRGIPVIEAAVNGHSGQFYIDTGDRANMSITSAFAVKSGLIMNLSTSESAMAGWGIGGPIFSSWFLTHQIAFLNQVLTDIPLRILSAKKGGLAEESDIGGTFGGGLLSRYNLVFDYNHQTLYLKKNETTNVGASVVDRSGFWLKQGDASFIVLDVASMGPAAKAGFQIGDEILSVDGIKVKKLFLPDFRLRLCNTKTSSVQLIWQRSTQIFNTTLILEDPISTDL